MLVQIACLGHMPLDSAGVCWKYPVGLGMLMLDKSRWTQYAPVG